MKGIKSVYKIGQGPSSSHTVGPYNAALRVKKQYPEADRFEVTLFGSLAYTGKGHSTGKAIHRAMPEAEILFDTEEQNLPHPNTMLFRGFKEGKEICSQRIFSIGGGSICVEGEQSEDEKEIYAENSFEEVRAYCLEHKISLKEYIYSHEPTLKAYLGQVWEAMQEAVENGLKRDGQLPGGLHLQRKAKMLHEKRCYNESADITMNRIISSYAFAVSEENASEEQVVTAPTCGSCGVIPSVFNYMKHERGFPDSEILDALAVAGLLGNIIRTNASISGAECGCQAEIGSACSMAAGGLATLYDLSMDQVEYAAEIAMEHHLGLTCDPICGLVQIPCIERNAVAAMRAINCVDLSRFLYQTRKISFDEIIATMYRTGLDMDVRYRETSHGGLAEMYTRKTK